MSQVIKRRIDAGNNKAGAIRIGVVSDTHISSYQEEFPRKAAEDLKNMDAIIHAGDLVDLTVLDKLKSICKNVKAVYGNMDNPAVKRKLPEKEIIDAGKYKIGITHGYGPADRLIALMKQIFKNDDVDIIVFGHSHAPMNEKIDNTLYFNPGSPTDKIFSQYNSYGVLEINDKIEAKIVRI